jgi:hypothetical protein
MPHEESWRQFSPAREIAESGCLGIVKKLVRTVYLQGATSAFNLIISIFLLAMMFIGNCQLSVPLIIFCTLACVIVTKAGELSLQYFHLTQLKTRLPTAFVIGFVAISLPMVALTFIFNISAFSAFTLCALPVLTLSIYSNQSRATVGPSNDWHDTFAASVIVLTIGLLAKIPVSSTATLLKFGVLPLWSDYFLHGITIASFGSPFATGADMELAGVSRGFYHYAPFILPAAFQAISGMSGLALSTSLLLPLGLLIASFGIYTFSIELGGRVSGLITLTIIICIPAYSFLIQSGWFDFYWLLFIAPGSGYAIGVSAVVCSSISLYLKTKDTRILWFSLLLLCSLVVIRIHMFMLLAPTIISVLMLQHWRENIKLLSGVVVGTIAIVFFALHFSVPLHALWKEYVNPHDYLNIALGWSSFYGRHLTLPDFPFGLTVLAKVMVVLTAILSIHIILYPLTLWLSVRRNGFKETDVLPLLLILFFIGLMLFSPVAGNGDSTEYKHRHFPLLYVLISIYTITYGIRLMVNLESCMDNLRPWGYAFVIFIVSTTTVVSWNSNPARPNVEIMPWAGNFHDQSVLPGLLEVAQYIRINSKNGDVLTMGAPSLVTDPRAQIIEIISLTGIPAFVARPDLKMRGSQCVKEIVNKRLSLLNDLSVISSWIDAKIFLQNNGIRWYVSPVGAPPKWDANLKDIVFSSNGMSVYDAGHSASKVLIAPQC